MRRSVMVAAVGLAAALWGLGPKAADLDEILRPLPDKGQSVLDFDASYAKDWEHWHSAFLWQNNPGQLTWFLSDAYLSQRRFTPSAAYSAGITPKLALWATGDFAQQTMPYTNIDQDRVWNGSAGVTFRPSSRLQMGGFLTKYSHSQWSGSDDYWGFYFYDTDYQILGVSLDWLDRAKPGYENLVPDLNGLLRPLMDPGQDWISARLQMRRDWASWRQGYNGFNRSDSDDQWTLSAAWTRGLSSSWEVFLSGLYTPGYDVNSRNRVATWPWGSTETNWGVRRLADSWRAGAGVRYRWSPTGEATLSATRDSHADDVMIKPPNPVFPPYHQSWYTWSARLGWTILSRPTAAGEPLGRNLNGFKGPLLNRGQWLWDGSLSLDRGRFAYRSYTEPPVVSERALNPVWVLQSGVAYGLTAATQLRADLRINPRFDHPPIADEWHHGAVGASLVYQANPNVRARASYSYGLDESGGGTYLSWVREEHQVFSAGFTISW